ncbi:hypothetical protein FOG51_02506 [Hanseniaspora uvarum]|nr:hypothetical protein FOG51_02506 [Hanseniaspora uvarum]
MFLISSLKRNLTLFKRQNSNKNIIGLFLLIIFISSAVLINFSSIQDDQNTGDIVITPQNEPYLELLNTLKPTTTLSKTTTSSTPTASPTTNLQEVQKIFGDIISKIFNDYNPEIDNPYSNNFKEKDVSNKLTSKSLGSYTEKCPSPGYWEDSINSQWALLGYENMQSAYLKIQDSVKSVIKEKQIKFIKYISNHIEYPGTKKYKGDGIVMVAGGKYSVLAYSVIKMIRSRGTTLPIEVLIPEDREVDAEFCSLLSSDLNGKCIYLESIFDDSIMSKYSFKGFQYKSLALMASSFENCLLLDADDYPLKNLDKIFKDEAYTQNGLVLWPDFWRRTTHPFFYESAGLKVNTEKRVRNFIDSWSNMKTDMPVDGKVPYHDLEGTLPDPSSETGQLMINKKHHWKTLLLSMYYNVYGPNLYYHLLSQYAAGQGDKDTFIAAAHVLDLPYYQVLSVPSLDGYHSKVKGEGYRGVAYYQKDFREDYKVKKNLVKKMKNNELTLDKETYNPVRFRDEYFRADLSQSYALFAHCNLPKFNPLDLAKNQEYMFEGKHFRGLNSKECLGDLDMEYEIIQSYYDIICGDTKNIFEWMVKKQDTQVCTYLSERLTLFKENPL